MSNFVLANGADPNEMLHYAAFLLGAFTVCKSTNLGVSGLQRVNKALLVANNASPDKRPTKKRQSCR